MNPFRFLRKLFGNLARQNGEGGGKRVSPKRQTVKLQFEVLEDLIMPSINPLTPIPTQNNADGDTVHVQFSATTTDGTVPTYGAAGLPSGLSIDNLGNISGTVAVGAATGSPTKDGNYTATLTATAGADTASETVNFNISPSESDSGFFSVQANNDPVSTPANTPVAINLLANATWSAGDTVTPSVDSSPTHGTLNGLTYTPAVGFSGSDSFGYTITDPYGNSSSANVNITVTPPGLVTITANNISIPYGQPIPALTSSITITGGDPNVTDSVSAPTLSTSATAGSPVGTYTITASGATDTAGYSIGYYTGTLTITPAHLTVTADPKSKTYGDANPTFTATIAGFVNGDTASAVSGAPSLTSDAVHVGSYSIGVGLGTLSATNYDFPTLTSGTLTITPAALTITADDQSINYGDALPTLTASYDGFVNGDTESSLSAAPTLSTAATSASSVGDYAITASGAAASNYTISYIDGDLTVNQAHLTVTADGQAKTYGQDNPALTYTITGFVNGDTTSAVTGAPNLTSDATSATHVGSSPIIIDVGTLSATNYDFSAVNGTLIVAPAPLTIIANDQSIVYGQVVPMLTASYSGFVNGDSPDNLTTAPTLSTTAASGSAAGTYTIPASGAAASDYTISYVSGTLTVKSTIAGNLSVTVPGDQATNINTALPFSTATGNPITVTDSDASVSVTLTTDHGSLTLASSTDLTFIVGVFGTGASTTTFSGTATDISTALDGLIYTPDTNYRGRATLNISASEINVASPQTAQADVNTIVGGPLVQVSAVPKPNADELSSADAAPTVANTATFVVTRMGGDLSQSLTVNLGFAGLAQYPTDYTLSADGQSIDGSITFQPGEKSITVTLTALHDDTASGTRQAIIQIATMSDPTYFVGASNTATITIAYKTYLSITATVPVGLEPGTDPTTAVNAVFTGHRTGDLSQSLTVKYNVLGTAEAGDDFQTLPESFTFNPNQADAIIPVKPLERPDEDEVDKSLLVQLIAPEGAIIAVGGGAASAALLVKKAGPIKIDKVTTQGYFDGLKANKGQTDIDFDDALGVDITNAEQMAAAATKTDLKKIGTDKGSQILRSFTNVRFSADLNGDPGSVIQVVDKKHIFLDANGKLDTGASLEEIYAEGWVVDAKGVAKTVDTHYFGLRVNPAIWSSETYEVTMKVGIGLYDKKVLPGSKGGISDEFANENPAKGLGIATDEERAAGLKRVESHIQWLGPTTTYKIIVSIDKTGAWKIYNEAAGLDLSSPKGK